MFRVDRAAAARQSARMEIETSLERQDWSALRAQLLDAGAAETGPLLSLRDCRALKAAYSRETLFRKRIVMARHGFGSGEYQYFDDPLPPVVAALRERLYARLAPIANEMAECLGDAADWPGDLDALRARCAAAGQTRPTPLLLKYGAGDYNCLHQDLYGAVAFPLQVVVQLSAPGEDFAGGAFVAVETRPRMQSRATALSPAQGCGVIFATRDKPRRGARGWTRSSLRHGVSTVTRGERVTLGVIFHDAA